MFLFYNSEMYEILDVDRSNLTIRGISNGDIRIISENDKSIKLDNISVDYYEVVSKQYPYLQLSSLTSSLKRDYYLEDMEQFNKTYVSMIMQIILVDGIDYYIFYYF